VRNSSSDQSRFREARPPYGGRVRPTGGLWSAMRLRIAFSYRGPFWPIWSSNRVQADESLFAVSAIVLAITP